MSQGRKVLIICNEFPPLTGGVGVHAWQLARHLQQAGENVELLCDTGGDPAEQSFDQAQTFTVHRSSPSAATRFRIAWQIMKNFEPDVLICSNRFAIWLGALLRKFFPRPVYAAVLHGKELLQRGIAISGFTRYSLPSFQQLLAVSAYTRSLIGNAQDRQRCQVIPNGIDPAMFKWPQPRLYAPGQPLVLGTLGTVRPRKGHLHVIRALPALQKKYGKVLYRIAGLQQFPAYLAQIRQMAAQLGVSDAVEICGQIPFHDEEAVLGFYRSLTIYVMLSEVQADGDTEGFGISALEAQAMGLPVLGSTHCGLDDAVRAGKSGELIQADDSNALLSATEKILTQYEEYSRNALEQASHYHWRDLVKDYQDIFPA